MDQIKITDSNESILTTSAESNLDFSHDEKNKVLFIPRKRFGKLNKANIPKNHMIFIKYIYMDDECKEPFDASMMFDAKREVSLYEISLEKKADDEVIKFYPSTESSEATKIHLYRDEWNVMFDCIQSKNIPNTILAVDLGYEEDKNVINVQSIDDNFINTVQLREEDRAKYLELTTPEMRQEFRDKYYEMLNGAEVNYASYEMSLHQILEGPEAITDEQVAQIITNISTADENNEKAVEIMRKLKNKLWSRFYQEYTQKRGRLVGPNRELDIGVTGEEHDMIRGMVEDHLANNKSMKLAGEVARLPNMGDSLNDRSLNTRIRMETDKEIMVNYHGFTPESVDLYHAELFRLVDIALKDGKFSMKAKNPGIGSSGESSPLFKMLENDEMKAEASRLLVKMEGWDEDPTPVEDRPLVYVSSFNQKVIEQSKAEAEDIEYWKKKDPEGSRFFVMMEQTLFNTKKVSEARKRAIASNNTGLKASNTSSMPITDDKNNAFMEKRKRLRESKKNELSEKITKDMDNQINKVNLEQSNSPEIPVESSESHFNDHVDSNTSKDTQEVNKTAEKRNSGLSIDISNPFSSHSPVEEVKIVKEVVKEVEEEINHKEEEQVPEKRILATKEVLEEPKIEEVKEIIGSLIEEPVEEVKIVKEVVKVVEEVKNEPIIEEVKEEMPFVIGVVADGILELSNGTRITQENYGRMLQGLPLLEEAKEVLSDEIVYEGITSGIYKAKIDLSSVSNNTLIEEMSTGRIVKEYRLHIGDFFKGYGEYMASLAPEKPVVKEVIKEEIPKPMPDITKAEPSKELKSSLNNELEEMRSKISTPNVDNINLKPADNMDEIRKMFEKDNEVFDSYNNDANDISKKEVDYKGDDYYRYRSKNNPGLEKISESLIIKHADVSILRDTNTRGRLDRYYDSAVFERDFFAINSSYGAYMRRVRTPSVLSHYLRNLHAYRDNQMAYEQYRGHLLGIIFKQLRFEFDEQPTEIDFLRCTHKSDLNGFILQMALMNRLEDDNGKVEILDQIKTLQCPNCERVISLKNAIPVNITDEFVAAYPMEIYLDRYAKYRTSKYSITSIYDAYRKLSEVGKVYHEYAVNKTLKLGFLIVYSLPTLYKETMVTQNQPEVNYDLYKDDLLTTIDSSTREEDMSDELKSSVMYIVDKSFSNIRNRYFELSNMDLTDVNENDIEDPATREEFIMYKKEYDTLTYHLNASFEQGEKNKDLFNMISYIDKIDIFELDDNYNPKDQDTPTVSYDHEEMFEMVSTLPSIPIDNLQNVREGISALDDKAKIYSTAITYSAEELAGNIDYESVYCRFNENTPILSESEYLKEIQARENLSDARLAAFAKARLKHRENAANGKCLCGHDKLEVQPLELLFFSYAKILGVTPK